VADGSLPATEDYDHILNNCLLCMACVENCSSSVRVDRLVTGAREALVHKRGLSWPRKRMHSLLKGGRWAMDTLFRGGSLAQSLLFRRIPESSGLRRRFALPWVEAEQVLPSLARKPFRRQHPDVVTARKPAREVIFFTGCSTNYIYPGIGEAVLKVLNNLNVSVSIPGEQSCCGAPVEAAGDRQTCLDLARGNLKALTGQDRDLKVVVCCSSGGYMFKTLYPELFAEDPELSGAAADLASRTCDISEYLVHEIGLEAVAGKIVSPCGLRTTYHDPCHLKRAQGVSREPRRLLELACPDSFAEMEEPDRCCGLGGTYGVTHREMSKKIRGRKVQSILDVQAGQVATGCPACMIQLQEGLHQAAPKIQVRHTIEVLAQAMRVAA
jgi:glycolate oxidase iron-sulfur subunit